MRPWCSYTRGYNTCHRRLPYLSGADPLSAGALRMNTFDFFIMDFLAALLSVPIFVYMGYYFGGHIDKAAIFVSKFSHIILTCVIVVIIIGTIFFLLKNRSKAKV